MEFASIRKGFSLLAAGIFSPVLLCADPVPDPAAAYLPKIVLDEFNPDVNDAGRAKSAAASGGKLRIRTPVDYQHLNNLTVTGQPERVVINHMSDSLVDQDFETLEYYPEMAWSWREADLIKTKTGEQEIGRIVARDADTVTFVAGAWKTTFGKFDVVPPAEGATHVVLTEQWGGEKYEGRLRIRQHTIQVDAGFDSALAAGARKIAIAELDTWEFRIGTVSETRPFAKEAVVFDFRIRPGVTWSDGEPFTAEDVKFSYQTLVNPAVDAQSLRNHYEDVESCEVTDGGKSVVFKYRKTYFQALSFLGGRTGASYFVPRHIFKPEQFGGDEKAFAEAFNKSEFKERPVYTGPYRLKEWRREDSLTITRNEKYWKNNLPDGAIAKWKKGQPWLDEITWTVYKESAASTKDLLRGVLDVDLDVEPSTWVQADTNTPEFLAAMTRAEKIGFLYTYIGWNLTRPIFQDKRTRRALAMLIPREDICRSVHHGVAFPVDGPMFVNGPGYDKTVKPIAYDLAAGRRELARAGWLDRDGDGILEKNIDGQMVPLSFTYSIHNARDYHQKIADIIKESVEQAGIRMTILKSDWTIFSTTVKDKNFDAVRFAWGTEIEPDPFQIFHSSQMENKGDNFVSYKNERVDELCVRIRETLDPVARWEMAREVHRLIAEDQPYCFLEGFKETYFINRKLRGVKLYPDQYTHDFTEWYWSAVPENRR